MGTQVLQDSEGNETGVFIPIEEWNRMKADYPGIAQEFESNESDGFVLSESQIKRLEEAINEPKENCISEKDMLKLLRKKNATVQA